MSNSATPASAGLIAGAGRNSFPHAPLVAGAERCPAAAIGRQLAEVCALMDQVDGADGDPRTHGQLEALSDHLFASAEWVTPSSLDGLMVIAMALRDAGEDLAEEAPTGDETKKQQRFARLNQRLMEGLAALAGHTPKDIGLGHYWSGVCAVAPDRSDLRSDPDQLAA